MSLDQLGVEAADQLRVAPEEAGPGSHLVRGQVDCRFDGIVAHAIKSSASNGLVHRLRRAAGEAAGALILLHGRGVDENDLFPLLEELDPERRLVGATARGPLTLPPGGFHWYAVHRIGYPEPETFRAAYPLVEGWIDSFLSAHGLGPERAVLGGFSQGAVMSYALGLAADRPTPAGILALSGFMPTVDGFELDLGKAAGLPVAIGHGIYDPIIGVDWGRAARERLEDAGARVTYRESPMPHAIDPDYLDELRVWVERLTSSP
jgi:phospholipase/carboxylesterase